MNDNTRGKAPKSTKGPTINEDGTQVLDPREAMGEQTLAVDLAGVEIDRQIATAHAYPRNIDTVVKKIATLALYNKDAAESCVYALPRAGKPIIGPSIGFANIVAQAWGNCRVGARITYIDKQQKVVIAEGAFLDLESNTQSIVPVNRRIVDSKGRLYSDDMQIVTGMAAASIARRNAILQGVTRGLWYPVWLEALGIVRGSVETFAENREKAFKALAQFGVTPVMVVGYLGLKGEIELTFEHIPTLRGMYQQLRDGVETVEKMFDPRRMTGRGFETVENPLGDGENDDETTGEDGTEAMGEAPGPKQPAAGAQAAGGGFAAPATQASPPVARNGAAATKAAPAPQPAPATAPATADSGSETQAGEAVTEEGPREQKPPGNAEEYADHWETVCARATSAEKLKNQWALERSLRTTCGLMGDEFDRIKQLFDATMTRLLK